MPEQMQWCSVKWQWGLRLDGGATPHLLIPSKQEAQAASRLHDIEASRALPCNSAICNDQNLSVRSPGVRAVRAIKPGRIAWPLPTYGNDRSISHRNARFKAGMHLRAC